MKEKLNISLIVTVITLVFSIGGAWAIVKVKTDKIDKLEEVVIVNDKKIAVLETKLDNIDYNLKEQKEDLKQILKAVKA